MNVIHLIVIFKLLWITFSLLDISNYTKPNPNSTSIQYLAILGTNDLHGAFYPKIVIDHHDINKTYSHGGLEYLGKYITILRNEYKENFLWFDSADIFHSTIESEISNGTIINDFYNAMKLDANTIGNHDWENGQKFLIDFMSKSDFPYIISNIRNTSSNKDIFLPNQIKSKIFSMPNSISIGVIGITTITTPNTTRGDLTNIQFLDYVDVIIREVKKLRDKKVNSIILISHAGIKCLNDSIEKYKNMIRTKDTIQEECREKDELYQLLHALPKNMIDLVIAGHLHDIVHHWINEIPVITSLNNGYYGTIALLPFNIQTKKLLKNYIAIEGPFPVCQKIFANTKQCMPLPINLSESNNEMKDKGDLVDFSFHNIKIEKESMLSGIANKWKRLTNLASNTTLVPILKSLHFNEAYRLKIGYFYSDIMIKVTGADISLLTIDNYISLWDHNYISNNIVSFEVSGRELHVIIDKMIELNRNDYSDLPLIKGLAITINTENEVNYIKIFDGKYKQEIINEKYYRLVSLDNLIHSTNDKLNCLKKWFQSRKIKQYNLFKEEIKKYLQYIDAIDLRDNLNSQKSLIKISKSN